MTSNPHHIKVKDHSVSGEEFTLEFNTEQDILITRPQPSKDDIGNYYKSEDYISHTDSKRSVFERVYHLVRSYSIKKKLALIESYNFQNKTLLDIGCGTGHFLKAAKEKNWNVFGVEPNASAKAIAEENVEENISHSIKTLEASTSNYQVITLWHVLEHLHDLEDQINSIVRLMETDGRLIVAVPNFKSYDAKFYGEFWAAYDVPRHLWHFSKEGIERMFSNYDMEIEEIKPLKFDAYYVSLLSEKYKSGWMNIFRAFIVGTRSNLKAKGSGEYSSLIYVLKKAQNAI